MGLPRECPAEWQDCAREILHHATVQWQASEKDGRELYQWWCDAMDDVQQDIDCSALMVQWLVIRWLENGLPDAMQDWDDPDAILYAESQAYAVITGAPVYKMLQKKEKISRPEPPLPLLLNSSVNPPRTKRISAITTCFSKQAEFLSDLLEPCLYQPKDNPKVPVICGPHGERIILIVHLFAGRRRDGDLHSWVDQYAEELLPDYSVWTLSFDTAIHQELGNLTGGNFEKLVQVAAAGASASGPPCETFSPARHLPPPPECGHRWPRPPRSPQDLWGLCDRSLRELEQLRTGNRLYFNCNLLEFHVALRGGTTLLLHPADPGQPEKCSSWQSRLHQHYAKKVMHTDPIRIDQWRFGAPTAKPTVIRAMKSLTARYEMHRHYLGGLTKPKAKLAGLDADGSFRTAVAKEYPMAMSKALAVTIVKDIASKLRLGHRCVDCTALGANFEWLNTVRKASAVIRTDATMLPDYQR